MTVQRQFLRNVRQAQTRSEIVHLVQKLKLTGSVGNSMKGSVGLHGTACVQASVACIHEVLLHNPKKIGYHVPSYLVSKECQTYHHAVAFYVVSLENPNVTFVLLIFGVLS